MNWPDLIPNINWIAVILMTIFSFVVGFLWHLPLVFGKTWENENKPDKAKLKSNTPYIFTGTAILHFIMLAALSAVVSGQGSLKGLETGFIVSICWLIPSMGGTYLFAGRSLKLLAVDAGMYVLLFSLAGLVFGSW